MSEIILKKKCTKCGKVLFLNKFYKDKTHRYGVGSWCKLCCKKRYKKMGKDYWLRRRHNITLEEYNKILKKQNYRCALCGKHQNEQKKAMAVDHNHRTSHIRGLLCIYCNHRLLRYFKDIKNLWEGFIKYANQAIKNDKNWRG